MTPSSSSAPLPHPSLTTLSPSSSLSSSSTTASSPCAACKFLRRKCQPDCVFAPYFPPDNPQKFVHVHRVFGASNVTKILNDLPTNQREDAVNSLAYEADMRLRDPVYGCVGVISVLQHQLRQLQMDLSFAKAELSKYQNSALVGGGPGVVNVSSVNHSGFGFGREGQLLMGVGREGSSNTNHSHNHNHHHHGIYQQHLMMRNYDAEMAAARMGVNGGGYDHAGIVAAMGGSSVSVGMLGGQFLKPSIAGGEERPGIGPQ